MNSDDTFLLRLAELTMDGEAKFRALISEQLAFAQTHVVELPQPGETVVTTKVESGTLKTA